MINWIRLGLYIVLTTVYTVGIILGGTWLAVWVMSNFLVDSEFSPWIVNGIGIVIAGSSLVFGVIVFIVRLVRGMDIGFTLLDDGNKD
jgi:hypothetical protein